MKLKRDVFIYLEPKPRDGGADFAQCESCRLFVPEVRALKGARCVIHGSKQEVYGTSTCGLYVDWPTPGGRPDKDVVAGHAAELAAGVPGSVTPEESGLVHERVQCQRCRFAERDATVCGLYKRLSAAMPQTFNLDISIRPRGCCNAWDG